MEKEDRGRLLTLYCAQDRLRTVIKAAVRNWEWGQSYVKHIFQLEDRDKFIVIIRMTDDYPYIADQIMNI